jgi:hypothetical protein
MTKRRVQDLGHNRSRRQSLTPKSIWGTGKDLQGPPDRGGAYAGTRSRGHVYRAGGRFGKQYGIILHVAFLLSAAGFGFDMQAEVGMEYVKSMAADARGFVSVEHASSWVALKGPWRQACARVGGR